jgi:hypothetical protein
MNVSGGGTNEPAECVIYEHVAAADILAKHAGGNVVDERSIERLLIPDRPLSPKTFSDLVFPAADLTPKNGIENYGCDANERPVRQHRESHQSLPIVNEPR